MKKITIILFVFAMLFLYGCSLSNDTINNSDDSLDENNYVYDGDYYFPIEIGIDDDTNHWYSSQLHALKEPIIYSQVDNNISIYRFTCLRTFQDPFSIRIEIGKEKSARLYFKMRDSFDLTGKLEKNKERKLEKEETREFLELLKRYDYLSLPFYDESMGLDGSIWIVEILEDNKYHAVTTWSPENGAIYDLGKLFVDLSRQVIDEY